MTSERSGATPPPALLEAYRNTDYRVRLPRGGWAVIRIGAPLPAALAALLGPGEPWGFITAWNPGSRPAPRAANHRAQRALFAALRRQARLIRPGLGVGEGGWREPSLWAAGVGHAQLCRLARRHGQLAFVHGGAVAALALTGAPRRESSSV